MKFKIPFITLFSLLIFACNEGSEEETLTYPRTYVLKALENPHQVAYEIENGSYTEIDFRPEFDFDEEQLEMPEIQAAISLYSPNPDLSLILENTTEIFYFKEIELLSESEIRLANSLGEEINTTYRIENGRIVLTDDSGRDLIICCTNEPPIDEGVNVTEFRSGFHHYIIYFYQPFLEERLSQFVIDGFKYQFTSPDQAMGYIIEDEKELLTSKDTIFLTLADWVYQLEN